MPVKVLFVAFVLMLPIAAHAEDVACQKSEIDCLAQVLAEKLVQAEMQLIHNEAHLRYHPPEPPPEPPAEPKK